MESNRAVKPIKPVAPYLGGKKNLADRVISIIEATPHATYVEPFVGMGGIFLRRRYAAKAEVINDRQQDVSNFFRILQRHYVAFMEMMRFQITTRAEFERLIQVDPGTLTDMERAARFLYLQRLAFAGKPAGRTFGTAVGRPARFDVTKLGPMLEDLHTRLSGVVIECRSFEQVITDYDRQETFFYLDPPYYGTEKAYGRDLFERSDFTRLAEILAGLQGRFVLSLNDVPEVRDIFSGFNIDEVSTSYSVGTLAGADAEAAEVIITGGKGIASPLFDI